MILKNLARGGKTYHGHRREITRALLESRLSVAELNEFLRDRLFLIRPGWRAFKFASKDWELADRLMVNQRSDVTSNMIDIALAYIDANQNSVAHLYTVADTITGQILSLEQRTITVPTDSLTPEEWQSRFGFKILCATNELSPQDIKSALENVMAPSEWCRARLMYPMVNQTVNRPHPESIETFLDYFVSGGEQASERAALKLLLHHDAARYLPLAFKIYIGLMGHPFDTCELLLDHIELEIARDGELSEVLRPALERLAELLPNSRAADIAALLYSKNLTKNPQQWPCSLLQRLERYGLGKHESELLSSFASLASFNAAPVSEKPRPLEILAIMRANTYPEPEHFASMVAIVSVWDFVDGGRIAGALMRSLYMVDRAVHELESRDVLRLVILFGGLNHYIATAPSAIPFLRRMVPAIVTSLTELASYEAAIEHDLNAIDLNQRLWINRLQWGLRAHEEGGKIQRWLQTVRAEAKLRPLYLTGINWPWVEEVLVQQKLKAFRSFDGAYLLLIGELESRNDPQRLKLVLDKLLREQSTSEVVETLISEFGDVAPAFVTRYLTTANLLTSGRAANYFSALTQRIEALETCIRRLGYNATLPREMYEGETRVLTTELLLLNVNAGKFEVPWDLFSSNTEEKHRDGWEAFGNINQSGGDEALSAFAETSRLFRNGHKENYRYRRNDVFLFLLVVQIVEDFLDHPAFGLEIILSGRFRHNNLLQEIHAAISTIENSTIHPITRANTKKLASAYRRVAERVLFQWCSRILQTRRKDKSEAVFHIIPNSDEVNAILKNVVEKGNLQDVVLEVIEWIKSRLRPQVDFAGQKFVSDMKTEFDFSFSQLLQSQINECDNTYRIDDARRVHQAVLNAVLRRVEALQDWFDGIDTQSAGPVSLAQLAHATEALFENVLSDRELKIELDFDPAAATFEPSEVKVAFDLMREVAFNALKHASDSKVHLRISQLSQPGLATFVFSNAVNEEDGAGEVSGTQYMSKDDALRREGNSGRLKIAASAATLLGRSVVVKWVKHHGRYELMVPMRAAKPALEAT